MLRAKWHATPPAPPARGRLVGVAVDGELLENLRLEAVEHRLLVGVRENLRRRPAWATASPQLAPCWK